MKPCPYSYHAIYTVAHEIYLREQDFGETLLSGDAAVLLDFLIDKGCAVLASEEFVLEAVKKPGVLWIHWIVQHTLEKIKHSWCPTYREWMPVHALGGWLENRMVIEENLQSALESYGDMMPDDLHNCTQMLLQETGPFRDSTFTHWRLYPSIAKALKS